MITRLMDASEGMQILAASGMETNNILETSGDMLTLMSAGAIDADTSASVLTNSMAQFNLEAKDSGRIIDVFAQGASSAKLGVDDLEYIMAQAGGTLASMNMEMEDSVAMAGQLANAGAPIGTIGTTLNAMGREIKANAKEFKALGIEVYDASGKLKGADKVMMELEGKLDGLSDAQRDAALSSVFSGQAMKGAVDWLSLGSEKYNELASEIKNSEGAALEMSEVMEDNFGGAMRSLQSALGTVMINIGDVLKGPIKDVANRINEIASAFNELDPDKKGLIVKLGAIATAMGPILKIGGKVLGTLADYPKLLSPTSLGIALIGTSIMRLWKNSRRFRNHIEDGIQNIRRITQATGQIISNLWDKVGGNITKTFKGLQKALDRSMRVITELTVNTLGVVADILEGNYENVGESLKAIGTDFLSWITTIPGQALRALSNIDIFNEWFTNSGMIDSIDFLMEKIGDFSIMAIGAIKALGSFVLSVLNGMGEGIFSAVSNTLGLISGTIESGLEIIGGLFRTFGSILEGDWSGAWDNLKETANAFVDWFFGIPGQIWAIAKDIGRAVKDGFSAAGSWVYNKTVGRVTGKKKRSGITTVPYDGYPIEAHKGEMLLTKSAADQVRKVGGNKSRIPTMDSPRSSNVSFSPDITINVQGNADKQSITEMERAIERVIERERNIFIAKMKLGGGQVEFS